MAVTEQRVARQDRAPEAVPDRAQRAVGIAPAMLPELPLPTKIRTAFHDGMDTLARRRAFPVFG